MGQPSRAPGDRIGPYELVRHLGTGGAGEVWEVVLHGPAGFRRSVALKLLHSGLDDPAARAAFVREARLGALLHHPNVVGTLHLGEYDGGWCVALELVRGPSLDVLWRRSGARLPPAAVLDVGVQAAAALRHVHAFRADDVAGGLVHRDVKPANLLVDRSGLVKLTDLGISLLAGERGEVAGTAAYMPPEQADGRPEPRSDVFGLAATLYTLAAARRPFGVGGKAFQGIRQVDRLLADPQFLAPVEESVPGLGEILRACLRSDPAARPSAREVGDALAALRGRLGTGPTLLEVLSKGWPDLGVEVPPTPVSDLATRVILAGNLATPRDGFLGREAELERVQAAVASAPWVVLVGPGGMGKTRLAVEVALRLQLRLPGGVWVVDLTEARTEDAICGTLAAVLGVDLDARDPVAHVGRLLRARGDALVVLDNLEQCVGSLAATVGRWTDLAPTCRFLGTSRVLPGLPAEVAVHLGELAPADAAALLVARAPRELARPERDEVEGLVEALEGMPLAIELAAARLRLLDVRSLRARLSLALLSGGSEARPARHRSVRASLAWSADLLSDPARRALCELAVFEGSFDTAAAEAVLGHPEDGAPWALDLLTELVDASLLQVDPVLGRFRASVVVREYAAGQLEDSARAAAEARHVAHYAQVAETEFLPATFGPSGEATYDRLVRDADNVVAACRRAIDRGDAASAVVTLRAAARVLDRRGPLSVLVSLAERVGALDALAPPDRYAALSAAGKACDAAGRGADALAHLSGALEVARVVGPHQELVATGRLGWALYRQGRSDEALDFLERACALSVNFDEPQHEAATHTNLGIVHRHLGRYAEARAHYDRALLLHRRHGNRQSEANVLGNLGVLHLDEGRPDVARRHLEQCLALDRELGNRRSEAIVLTNLGQLHLEEGRLDQAEACSERALALSRDVGDRRAEASATTLRADVDLERGALELGRERVLQGIALCDEVGDPHSLASLLVLAARFDRASGRSDDARDALGRARDALRRIGDRRGEGIALRELARLHADFGGEPSPDALLDEAEALLRATSAPAELAIALSLRAALRVRDGARDAAAALVDEAAALAPWHAGAARAVARVRSLLG